MLLVASTVMSVCIWRSCHVQPKRSEGFQGSDGYRNSSIKFSPPNVSEGFPTLSGWDRSVFRKLTDSQKLKYIRQRAPESVQDSSVPLTEVATNLDLGKG